MAHITVVVTVNEEDKRLSRRLESVLGQLNAEDEVLISANPPCPQDETLKRTALDTRVKIVDVPGRSPLESLEAALRQSSGEYIFLSEPGGVWHPGKYAACLGELEKPGVAAVVHDAAVVDGDFNEIEGSLIRHRFRAGLLPNLFKNRYTGCCMALRKQALKIALPFPPHISIPERWLGVAAGKAGRVVFLDRTLAFCCRRANGDGTRNATGTKLSAVREAVLLCFELSRRARRLSQSRDKSKL